MICTTTASGTPACTTSPRSASTSAGRIARLPAPIGTQKVGATAGKSLSACLSNRGSPVPPRAVLSVLRARTHRGAGNWDASRGIDHRALGVCRQTRRGRHVRDPERHQTDRQGHRQGKGHDASHRVSSDVSSLEARNRLADRTEPVPEVRDRPWDRAERVSEAPDRPSDRASGSTLQARDRPWDRADGVSNVPDRPSDRLHRSSPSSCIDVHELPAVARPGLTTQRRALPRWKSTTLGWRVGLVMRRAT